MDYQSVYQSWLNNPGLNEEGKAELLSVANDAKAIEYRFGAELEFGTAGMRGIIGYGTNMMNVFTVRRATQGERDDTRRIPAGTYACMFHKGDLESHARAFARMMEDVKARSLTPAGDVYALTQMSYVLWEDNGETHIARYAVRVEESPRP